MYNAIRVFIAGYVWMTGYGNFMYYYKTSNFSFGRCAYHLPPVICHHISDGQSHTFSM